MSPKFRRVGPKETKPFLGRSRAALVSDFLSKFPSGGQKIRFYRPPGDNNFLVVHTIAPNGSQKLFKAVAAKGKLDFEFAGYATSGFTHKEVIGEALRRKGLASKMLKVHEATERSFGEHKSVPTTSTKSTLLLLLSHGYRMAPQTAQELARHGIKNEGELKAYLMKKDSPEELPFHAGMEKRVRRER